MTRVALFTLIFLGVWAVFTAVFAASASKVQVRLLPKWAWVILCLVVPFFGGLLYLMVGRPVGGAAGAGGGLGAGFGRGAGRRQPKVVAPDDDPRFLRDLEKRLREQQAKDPANDSAKDPANDQATDSGQRPAQSSEGGQDADPNSGAAPGDDADPKPKAD